MKIIIYQANEAVPFSELYKPLGGFNKLFFSNKISQFDESHIKILIPNNLEQDDSTFLVPENWKVDFFCLLNNKFPDIKWQEIQTAAKPPKREIGSGWSEVLSQFYEENVEILEIWTSKKTLKVWTLKVVVYTTETEVPFEGFYYPLGSYKKVIFSNVKECFNENTLNTLLEDVDIKDKTAIFYVPLNMIEKFKQSLKNKFQGTKFEEREPTPNEKSSKGCILELLGIGIDWDQFTRFVKEKMGIISVVELIPDYSPYTEYDDDLQKKINGIVKSHSKTIDCIFFATVRKGKLVRMSKEPPDSMKMFDCNKVNKILTTVKKIEDVRHLGKGEFDCAIFQFGDPKMGGTLCLSFVPDSRPKLWLGFISTTYVGLVKFLSFRKDFLPDILLLSKKDMSTFY